ncbi:MAG: hypothetical protein U1E05_00225 [Patescibacteria group bacterium]|nr:hypothetical protein [Patescibacteria group bacterium]
MRRSTTKRRPFVWPVTAVLLLGAAMGGCSSAPEATYRVEGVVTFNGEPVQAGTVLFETAVPALGGGGYTARGAIDSRGRYSLSTFATDDGAVAGRHRVAVVPSNVGLGDGADHAAAVVIPHQYTTLSTSPLEFEVHASSNQIDIELHTLP